MSSRPAPSPKRVLLADVAGAGRRAVAELLRALPGAVLVSEAGTPEALAHEMRCSAPDVLVIDDRLVSALGFGPRDADVAMIVVGVDDDPSFARRVQRFGAMVWIPKERSGELLPDLLDRVDGKPGAAGPR